jgi:hypothetical protein
VPNTRKNYLKCLKSIIQTGNPFTLSQQEANEEIFAESQNGTKNWLSKEDQEYLRKFSERVKKSP